MVSPSPFPLLVDGVVAYEGLLGLAHYYFNMFGQLGVHIPCVWNFLWRWILQDVTKRR